MRIGQTGGKKKLPTCEGEALSSQKTSLQEHKPAFREEKGGFASKDILSNEPSDPIVTPSSLPGVSSPLQDDNEKPDNSDPIEFTPPSQCHPPDTASKALLEMINHQKSSHCYLMTLLSSKSLRIPLTSQPL